MYEIYKVGQIVFCKQGRDKGNFFVVSGVDDKFLYLLDGKRRKVGKAKRKNPSHVALTKTVVDGEVLASNREIRKVLSSFNNDFN